MRKELSHKIILLKCDHRSNSTVDSGPPRFLASVLLLPNYLSFHKSLSIYIYATIVNSVTARDNILPALIVSFPSLPIRLPIASLYQTIIIIIITIIINYQLLARNVHFAINCLPYSQACAFLPRGVKLLEVDRLVCKAASNP